MPAPTQATGSPFQTSSWAGTGTKTAGGGLSVGVGDLVVVEAVNEDAGASTIGAPSNTGTATVSWTARGTVTASGHCYARADTGSVTAAGTLTVSQNSAANNWGFVVYVFPSSGHGGLGLTPAGASGSAAPMSLTAAWTAQSLVACADGDWSAGITAPTYLTTNVGTPTQNNFSNADGNYTAMTFYYPNITASGSNAVGASAPNQTYSLIAVEVLGTTGGGGGVATPAFVPHRMPLGV